MLLYDISLNKPFSCLGPERRLVTMLSLSFTWPGLKTNSVMQGYF